VTAPQLIPLGRASDLLAQLTAAIRSADPATQSIHAAGSTRRFEPLVSSIDVVVCSDSPSSTLDTLARVLGLTHVQRSAQRVSARFARVPVDILIATPANCGTVLFDATGSYAHVKAVKARGLTDREFATEKELYQSLGLEFIPAELRHDSGEIEAAASNSLPRLIDVTHMRGDLHMHSVYSDGRDTIASMLDGCYALGYEYVAMTDHSWRSAAPKTLSVDDVARQRDEIDRLRESYPRMEILHGTEVDIMPDGSLDFEDDVLEGFDIVLTSLHNRANHDDARLTERSLQAIRHPLVNILCHPANRLVGVSHGYGLDFDALYAAALETGTALEVDGAPSHLDLDGERAREAAAAGVTLTIDSDCHRFDALGRQMGFGVGTARRGWVEPRHVLNTRSLADVRAFVAAKRAGRR
jgi:DNA polymerase (family 10)